MWHPDAVIYHKGCYDGVAAAWTVLKYLDRKGLSREVVRLIPVSPNATSIPDGLDGKRVIMVDITFGNPSLMDDIFIRAKSLTVLDHHETALQYTGYPGVIDMNRSGAQITWDFLMETPRPPLVDYVGDRDLWTHKLPDSKDINAYIYVGEPTIERMDQLHTEWNNQRYIFEGNIIRKAQDATTTLLCKGFYPATFVDKFLPEERSPRLYNIMVGDCHYSFRSDVGDQIMAHNPDIDFVVLYTYYMNTGTYNISFRGRGKVNLSQLAKRFGGGGHPNASGCNAKTLDFILV